MDGAEVFVGWRAMDDACTDEALGHGVAALCVGNDAAVLGISGGFRELAWGWGAVACLKVRGHAPFIEVQSFQCLKISYIPI
ncbi:MAG: hypothetical protein U0176_22085, partial [Bacteroidia bacterium]